MHWVLADDRLAIVSRCGVSRSRVEMLAPMFLRVRFSLWHNLGEGCVEF